jgi:hypothetical protein
MHIPQDSTQVEQHRDETHIGEFTVMFYQRRPLGCHQVTSETTELSLRIGLSQGTNQS